MKQLYRKILFSQFFLFLVLSSCVKDTVDELSSIKGVKASNQFEMPLVNYTVGMDKLTGEIIKSSLISQQSDSTFVFIYRSQDTVKQEPREMPSVPFNYSLQMTNPMIAAFTFNNGFNLTISDSAVFPSSNKERLKLIKVKEGSFTIAINNTFKHNTTIDLAFPNIKKDGIALTRTINFIYGTTPNPMTPIVIDLAGYDIDLSNGGTTFNNIPFTYGIAMVRNPANPTTTSDVLQIDQEFTIKQYSLLQGYLGRFSILKAHQEQTLSGFDNPLSGKIFVKDPRLVIRVHHSFGIPLTGKITGLKAIAADGNVVPVIINQFADTFSFKQPTTPGEIATSEYIIDRTNSNLDVVINSSPANIVFDLDFDANYREEVVNNYLADNPQFFTDMDFEMPMNIKITDYTSIQKSKQDTTAKPVENAQEVDLSILATNGLPFDIYMQTVYTNDTTVNGIDTTYLVDSLFTSELFIPGGLVNAAGDVTAPNITSLNRTISIEKYNKAMKADNSEVRTRLVTSTFGGTPGFVKVTVKKDATLTLRVGAKIKSTIKF